MWILTCTASDVTTAIYDKNTVCSANYLCKLNVISVAFTLSKSTHNCIACTLDQRNARAAPTWFPQVPDNPINLIVLISVLIWNSNYRFNPQSLTIAMTPVDLLIRISLVHLAEAQTQREFFRMHVQWNTFTRTNTLLYPQSISVKESHIGMHAHT